MMQRQQQDVRAQTLQCLRYIADRCDGAYLADGEGFSKYDTEYGKSLAAQYQISNAQLPSAAKLCRRYRRQLADGGLQPPSEAEVRLYLQQHDYSSSKPRSRRPAQPAMTAKQKGEAGKQQLLASIQAQQTREQQEAQQWFADDLLHDRHREMVFLYSIQSNQVADTPPEIVPDALRLQPEPEQRQHWRGRHFIALVLALTIGIMCWRWNIWLALILASLVFTLIEAIL